MSPFMRFIKHREGTTAIEYGLIAALIAIAIVVILAIIGNKPLSGFPPF